MCDANSSDIDPEMPGQFSSVGVPRTWRQKVKTVWHDSVAVLNNLLSINVIGQGQARGYGRITHKRGHTTGGHYFQDLFTAKPLDIHHLLGYQMNDLDIVFPKIPHNTL